MKTILKLAFRNIWRNKRRTFITAAAVAFSVFFAVMMIAFQTGIWQYLEDSSIKSFFGFVQIHEEGYSEEQTIEKSFEIAKLQPEIDKIPGLKGSIPRLESYGLASFGDGTTGVAIIGIDPEKEDALTDLKSKKVAGKYLALEDNETLIGQGLAEKLKMTIGDTLVLISQGYHGVNAAGKFPIKGIAKFPIPDLNKSIVYLSLAHAQQFYGAEGRATTMVLDIETRKEVPAIEKAAKNTLSAEYEFIPWQKMIPSLVETRQMKEGSTNVIAALLYFIVGFGIFGTILMMVKEREYEFGVMTSIGMRRGKLAAIIWLETIFVGFLGTVLGVLMSYPILYFVYKNPVPVTGEAAEAFEQFGLEMKIIPVLDWNIFANQAIIIFLITTILALYPILKIMKMKPVEAMRA